MQTPQYSAPTYETDAEFVGGGLQFRKNKPGSFDLSCHVRSPYALIQQELGI